MGLNPSPVDIAGPLAAAIDAARDLAWRPTFNMGNALAYADRQESAERLRALMAEAHLPDDPADELRYLFAAMVRVCVASFANRRGEPYYERKRLVYELRGCLDVYDREARS
jgi:hypothetical protein